MNPFHSIIRTSLRYLPMVLSAAATAASCGGSQTHGHAQPPGNFYSPVKTRDEVTLDLLGEPLDARWPDSIQSVVDPYLGPAERIEVTVDDLTMVSYFIDVPGSTRLAIYHQGHTGDARIFGLDAIDAFRRAGWSVIVCSMPLRGENSLLPNGSNSHDDLAGRAFPLRYFVWPVVESITRAAAIQRWDEVRMIGISGGGWTTMLVSALDDRVTSSFCVAGTWPKWLNDIHPGGRDLEQRATQPNLLDLYSFPPRAVHVFNAFDPCCFDGQFYDGYADIFPNLTALVVFNPSHSIHPSVLAQAIQ